MKKVFALLTSVISVFVLTVGNYKSAQAAAQTAFMPATTINIAHFFKPPNNMDAATAAKNFNMMVLTNGDYTYRDQMAASGFSSTIPEYFRSDGIQDPGSCTATPINNQVAYKTGDFCYISQNNPDWFLLDANGRRITVTPGGQYYRMDPSNPGWREFFLSRVIESQTQHGWSGLFLDNVEGGLSKYYDTKPAKYPDTASYQAAIAGFLGYLHANYSQKYGRPILGNIVARADDQVWFTYLQYLEGAMQERFAVGWNLTDYLSASSWQHDMDFMEQTQANGKYVILVAPGNQSDLNRQNFAFASYLLISNGRAAFRYSNKDGYRDVWLYNNYRVNLGTPLGGRYQVGTTWRRDFSRGTITVDPGNHTASIQIVDPATVGVGNYDDTHANWTYSGLWNAYKGSELYYNNTTHYTMNVGSSASFNFNGNQFVLSYAQATNRGSIGDYIDGNQVGTINANGSLQYQKKYTSPLLSNGVHVAQFEFLGGTGPVIDIDAIQILAPTPPGVGKYDDTNSNWFYEGSWNVYKGSEPYYNNTTHFTLAPGSSTSFAFTGTQFKLVYAQATNRGNIAVYIDGNLITTINANGDLHYQKVYISPLFSKGAHVAQFKFLEGSGPAIDIDAIEILNTTVPGAGKYDDTHANWTYSGLWNVYKGSEPYYENTTHYTLNVGSSAAFTFNGTQFILSYAQATNRGSIIVYIDGSQVGTINANGSLEYQKEYISPQLSNGTHVAQFNFIGGAGPVFDLDAIEIK